MKRELWVEQLEGALAALGEILAAEGNRLAIVVVGGATMNLLGIIRRTTSDIDVIARAHRDETGALRIVPPEPFPPELSQAIRTVALQPTPAELASAVEWVRTQDEAPEWTSLVEEVCRHVERSCS